MGFLISFSQESLGPGWESRSQTHTWPLRPAPHPPPPRTRAPPPFFYLQWKPTLAPTCPTRLLPFPCHNRRETKISSALQPKIMWLGMQTKSSLQRFVSEVRGKHVKNSATICNWGLTLTSKNFRLNQNYKKHTCTPFDLVFSLSCTLSRCGYNLCTMLCWV